MNLKRLIFKGSVGGKGDGSELRVKRIQFFLKYFQAQRQWKKLYDRLEVSKHNYHSCCRAERSAYIQMINSQSDTSLSQEGVDKSRERYEKSRKSVSFFIFF